jgi:hypothetical protein
MEIGVRLYLIWYAPCTGTPRRSLMLELCGGLGGLMARDVRYVRYKIQAARLRLWIEGSMSVCLPMKMWGDPG